MQAHSHRPSRAERITTSCGECRRRKQKCNQGQPCSNCARRFPQPVCEYRSNRRPSSSVTVTIQQPAFAVSDSPPLPFGINGNTRTPILSPRQHSSLSPAWAGQREDSVGSFSGPWAESDSVPPSAACIPAGPYAWSTEPNSFSTYILACEESCTSHSDDVHEAVKMLRAYRSVASELGQESWSPGANTWAVPQGTPSAAGGGFWSLADATQDVVPLPVPPTMQNSEILTTYVKLISQFKASLDGNPDESNPYIKYHVPYCVQSPLLVHVAIYTAACLLSETGHIDWTVAMAHKGYAIQLLNEHIASTPSPSDEGITGVIQLIVDEWYWGDTNELRAHLRGLREMIKIRGGLRTLGLHGLISKLAVTSDVAIAFSFETSPFLQDGSEFEFLENSQAPLRLALNTPFITSLPRFCSCDDALRIHPAVASILDDMRFLLTAVLALPENPSLKELQKVHSTAAWISDRTLRLPSHGPTVRRPSATTSPTSPSTTRSRSPGTDARATPDRADERPIPVRSRRQASNRSRSRQTARRTSFQTLEERQGRPSPPAPTQTDAPDFVYQAVRLAALMYSQAIKQRRPFSLVVGTGEFTRLWTTMWHVPLATWRSLLGVFNWLLLPLVSSGKSTPHDRFVKAMMNATLLQMGMDNWEIARGTMDAALKLQRWLGVELRQSSSPEAGGLGPESRRRQGSSESADDRGRGPR